MICPIHLDKHIAWIRQILQNEIVNMNLFSYLQVIFVITCDFVELCILLYEDKLL